MLIQDTQVSKRFVYIMVATLILGSCQKELSPEEYVSWVNNPENGLRISQTLGDFEVEVKYEPAEYNEAMTHLKDLNQSNPEYSEYEHFQFRIKSLIGGDILRYKENQTNNEVTRINHFSFNSKSDFKVIVGADTNDCKLSVYSRNYNLSPTIDLSMSFNKMEKSQDWQFIYSDKEFNLGTLKFMFRKEDLNSIPLLVI